MDYLIASLFMALWVAVMVLVMRRQGPKKPEVFNWRRDRRLVKRLHREAWEEVMNGGSDRPESRPSADRP